MTKAKNSITGRFNWLRSGSTIAAAAVLAAMAQSAPAHGQSMPGGVGQSSISSADLREFGRGGRLLRDIAPSDIPSISVRSRPTAVVLPNNPVAPVPATTQTISPAPQVPAPTANPAPSVPLPVQQGQSRPTERAVIPAPGDPGVNVQAFARYDTDDVLFDPNSVVDRIEILSGSAIIDWTTFTSGSPGSEVVFLGTGGNLEFTSNLPDYTVLNRILTPGFDSAVRIDGNVTSTVLGGNDFGGNIWFYSAGGLVIGSNASFNIGSLLLSTSTIDPADVTAGDLSVDLLGTPDSASAIRIENGATITANADNSYVAMVAPRIEQGGSVNVNGSTAYVAAEQATLTIQNGLFDISVAVGSEDANGIVHTGSTGGPSSTDVTDQQAIYFVSVPKNDAITMLVSGSVGYDAAASATVQNGNIILSTGNVTREDRTINVPDGSGRTVARPFSENEIDRTVDGGPAGNILLEDLFLTGSMEVFAEDTVTLQAGVSSPFDQITAFSNSLAGVNLDIAAGNAIDVNVTADGSISVDGSVNLVAGDGVGNGGDISINVDSVGGSNVTDSGTLFVSGNLDVDVRGRGLDDIGNVRNNGNTGIGTDGTGGSIDLTVSDSGSIDVGGILALNASANGGAGETQHGNAIGGDITVDIFDGGLSVGVSTELSSDALRAGTLLTSGFNSNIGSDSTAGSVTLNLHDGAIDINALSVGISADASHGNDRNTAQSNDAIAGSFSLNVTGGNHTIGAIDVFGLADAGISFIGDGSDSVGGLASRGTATINISNLGTTLDVLNSANFDLRTIGNSGAATGNAFDLTVTDTGVATGAGGLTIDGFLFVDTGAFTGAPGTVSEGGNIRILADNGFLNLNEVILTAGSSIPVFGGNFGQNGSSFQAGTISLSAINQAEIVATGNVNISASGIGLATASETEDGLGQGGEITLLADDGLIRIGGDFLANANGFALAGVNANGDQGVGRGGTVTITVDGNDGVMDFNDVTVGTDGSFIFDVELGNVFFSGDGSLGIGGTTTFNVLNGQMTAGDISVSSDGFGGPGGEGRAVVITQRPLPPGALGQSLGFGGEFATDSMVTGNGGAGTGGDVVFNLDGGNAIFDNLTVSANGVGGGGAFSSIGGNFTGGNGGDGNGGNATLNAITGSLTVLDTLSIEATGNTITSFGTVIGGDGGNAAGLTGGNGGDSIGGNATFNLIGTATINAQNIVVSTAAYGGTGGDSFASSSTQPDAGGGQGGNAVGGTAAFNDTAGNLSFGSLTVDASGNGGQGGDSRGFTTGESVGAGGNGGSGTGGTARISLNQDNATPRNFSVLSQGLGGDGGSGMTGGIGGAGAGGLAELVINNVSVLFDTVLIDSSAIGGQGGFSNGQLPDDGADGGEATGGDARLVVSGQDASFQVTTGVSLTAGAVGGAGSDGRFSINDLISGGTGGAGGSANGGSATIAVINEADITIDANTFSLDTDSVGGAGGRGGTNSQGGMAGAGGTGGDATGGTVGLTAMGGASVQVQTGGGVFFLSSSGTGGAGGQGGFGSNSLVVGAGGDGGNGTGGSPTLSATGARIDLGDVTLIADGIGGAGGSSGLDVNDVASGDSGNGGDGIGGTPLIEAVEGSPGIVTLGNTIILARGTGGTGQTAGPGAGGQVTISDMSTDPAGLISFGDLVIDATGDAGTNSGQINFATGSGAITVNGELDLDATGTVELDMEADGQLLVTGNATIDASEGLAISHSDQIGDIAAFDVSGALFANVSNGAVTATDNGNINAAGPVSITALDIAYDSITSASTVTLTATGGSITGTVDGLITASGPNNAIVMNAFDDVIFGDLLTLNGNVVIAGTNISGGNTQAAGGVELSAINTIDVGNISTTAFGDIILTNDIGSIFAGQLDAAQGSILLSASVDGQIASATASGVIDVVTGNDFTSGANISGDDAVYDIGGDGAIASIDADGTLDVDVGGQLTGGALTGSSFTAINAGTIDIAGANSLNQSVAVVGQGAVSIGDINAAGDHSIVGASVALGSGDVGGNLSVVAISDDIDIALVGNEQLLVGQAAGFNASGDMNVSHTGNSAQLLSLDVGGSLSVNLEGSFNSAPGSILHSGLELFIVAGGDITADDLRAVSAIVLSAGGDVTLNNASAIGPQGASNFRGIIIDAGVTDLPGVGPVFDNAANVTINGEVASYADILITTGGSAIFNSGANVAADNSLIVDTGDDIIVAGGARLSSANNPTDPVNPLDPFSAGPNIVLNAGGVTNLFSVPLTPIASVVIDGTLNANTGAIVLNGNAIEALDSDLFAGFIQADIRDAPANGATLSDDDGLLSGPCLEGVVCLGDMQAANRIEIGQSSNNDVIRLFINQAQIDTTDFLISTRDNIVMGTDGIDTIINATGTFSATSATGNVDLRDASITSNQILIDAAGSLLGSGVLSSTNDIGITVGDSLIVGGIITDGELTTVANVGGAIEGQYTVPGAFSADILSQGSADIDLTAQSIRLGEAVSPDNVNLTADDDAFLGLADVTGDITIGATNADYDQLTAGGSIAITANGGAINAAPGSSATAGGNVDLLASGAIDVGEVSADGDVDINGNMVGFTLVDAGGNATITAATGNLESTVRAGGTASLTANDGSIMLDELFAGDAQIIASNAIDIGEVAVAGLVIAQGSQVTLASLGNLEVDAQATSGDIAITAQGNLFAAANATGNVSLRSEAGNANFVTVEGQNISLFANGDLEVSDTANAVALLEIEAGGMVTVSGFAVGETITVDADGFDILSSGVLGDATRTVGIDFTSSSEIYLGGSGGNSSGFEIDNGEFARIHSGGGITISTGASTGALIFVDALDVIAGNGNSADGQNIGQSGALSLNSSGDISVIGNANFSNATTDTGLRLNAANLVFVNAATGGLFMVDSSGALAGNITINANDFLAVTEQAFGQIGGLSVTEIDERLADSDGVDRPDGIIRADSLTIETTASEVYIQNTVAGTGFDDRRGFEVNSLSISTQGSSPQPIVINGIVNGSTGVAAIAQTTLGSATAAGSTINGCLIADPASCGGGGVTTPPITSPITPPTQETDIGPEIRDIIEEAQEPDEVIVPGAIEGGLITLNPDSAYDDDPLIDDPVTGAGNEDLWVEEEEEEDELAQGGSETDPVDAMESRAG